MANLENSNKKQAFTSIDLLMCLTSILAISLLVYPVLNKNSDQKAYIEAMDQAELLSQDLIKDINMPQFEANVRSYSKNRQARRLASDSRGPKEPIRLEGLRGSDPWGNPYHYRVMKDLYGKPTHLVVWSRGSNAVQDTSEFDFKSDTGEVNFEGDDVGYISQLVPSKY